MADGARVILVEDDPTVRRLVGAYLDGHGYETISCANGIEGRTAFRAGGADLLIVDRMLPGLSGDDLSREVRAVSSVPIIMLTALRGEEDRIDGLELGVDDYLGKPFSMKELLLRVEAVLRRTRPHSATQTFTVGCFAVDPTGAGCGPAGRRSPSPPASMSYWCSCCTIPASCSAATRSSPVSGAGRSETGRR